MSLGAFYMLSLFCHRHCPCLILIAAGSITHTNTAH